MPGKETRRGPNFRTEEMTLCEIFFEIESAYECVAELGELGAVQFKDMNISVNDFRRKYVNKIHVCCDMERRLNFIEKELVMNGIAIAEPSSIPCAPKDIDDLEVTIQRLNTELETMITYYKELKRAYLHLEYKKQVLVDTNKFFESPDQMDLQSLPSDDEQAPLLEGAESVPMSTSEQEMKFSSRVGVILQEKVPAFERMLFRVCHRNICVQIKPLETPFEDPEFNTPVMKSVFIIFFQGEMLKMKVNKICEGFNTTVYDCPDNIAQRKAMLCTMKTDMEDINLVLNKTSDLHHRLLLASANNLRLLNMKVLKVKGIYHTLNMFKVTSSYLVAHCWVPVSHMQLLTLALQRGSEKSSSDTPPVVTRLYTSEEPPTYNSMNKYIEAFQVLVDSYGVSKYGEINPAIFSIITFPFLFAVMFGDVGHGLILLLVGIYFLVYEEQVDWERKGEIIKIFFEGRYMIILMGLFSIYTGIIYNELFSVQLNIFGSRWTVNYTEDTVLKNKYLELDPEIHFSMSPYPLGFDPVWKFSENGLSVMNSFKMKVAVILGVVHMLFGITLSLWNFVYFKNKEDIFGEFIPHLLFMSSIFLYMVFLIFFKWTVYGPHKTVHRSIHCSPSVLTTLIMMILFQKGKYQEHDACDPYMFPYQYYIQLILLALAAVCVPWMLLYTPIHMCTQSRATSSSLTSIATGYSIITTQSLRSVETTTDLPLENGEISCGEMFIHQGIQTIEFVLGSISHTASYLRLWALSLAHSQLSDVLWSMVLRSGMRFSWPVGSVCIAISFSLWAVFTITIMVLMEGLSAFLHTLRLHWVEFQSKFYRGTGYRFTPFSFKTMFEEAHLNK